MASLVLTGDTSGSLTVSAPAVAGSNTQTLVATTGTLAPIVSGTVNAGGTTPFPSSGGPANVDFTGIPSWVKRVTVMFNGVSTNGTSSIIIQIGSGSFSTSGYVSGVGGVSSSNVAAYVSATAGFLVLNFGANTDTLSGAFTITNINSNNWVYSGTVSRTGNIFIGAASATPFALGGTLDRVRITTVNGIDTFDAGSINILYE